MQVICIHAGKTESVFHLLCLVHSLDGGGGNNLDDIPEGSVESSVISPRCGHIQILPIFVLKVVT